MVFGKEKLVEDKELESFLEELSWGWEEGHSAKQIAKDMKFGEPEPYGYPLLKTSHVYYFAKKYAEEYGMEPRRKTKKEEEDQKEKKPEAKEKQQKYIDPRFPHRYHKWTPDIPDCVADSLRRSGYLLNDPLDRE